MKDPLHELPGYALRRAAAAMMGEFATRIEPLGLRIADVSALLVIGANPVMTASQLGRMLDIQRANMVPLVARLEDAGLVVRTPLDGKSHSLGLTPAGEAKLAEARASRLNQLASEGIIAQARADEARAALAQARASLAEQRRLVALGGVSADGTMTLRAPITGRVAHVGPATGGPVDGTDAPFVIEAEGAYQVELQLPERLARAVRPGMGVEISLPASDGAKALPVAGQILAVSPSIDPATRSVMARASIGAAPGIVAGRNVSVTILGSQDSGGVAVPVGAVIKIGGADHVFVAEGKTYKPRKVTVAATGGGQAVIANGLKAGETVAASSIAELKAMNAE